MGFKYFRGESHRRLGVSREQYAALVTEQGGRCLICLLPETAVNKNLSIDHCHESGIIRGLLCRSCNIGLGAFKDDPILLNRAAEYTRKWNIVRDAVVSRRLGELPGSRRRD